MQSSQSQVDGLIDPALRTPLAGVTGPTFREQGEAFLLQLATRKRKPVHARTLFIFRDNLHRRINPVIGDLPISGVRNITVKPLIAAMADAGLKATYINSHFRLVARVVASFVDEQGEPVYP